MLRRGITTRDAFSRRALAEMNAGKGWWPVALTLLPAVQDQYQESDEQLLETLYAHTAGGYGVHKMTRAGRMTEVDDRLVADLVQRFPGSQKVCVHDMACSNAITSLELYRALEKRLNASVTASDYFDSIWLVKPARSAFTVAFDVDGSPIQFAGWGMVVSASHREPYRFPLNGLLRAALMGGVLPAARRMLEAHRSGLSASDSVVSGVGFVRQVRLFHPKCLEAATQTSHFELIRQDLFAASSTRFDVVRVMNALTPRHFKPERVRAGISNVAKQVRDGGLLLVGRSDEEGDGSARVTSYVRKSHRLLPTWSTNGGYEWPELVEQIVVED